jgi:hypothetical protein
MLIYATNYNMTAHANLHFSNVVASAVAKRAADTSTRNIILLVDLARFHWTAFFYLADATGDKTLKCKKVVLQSELLKSQGVIF